MSKSIFDGITTVIFDLDSTLSNTQRYPLEAADWLLSNIPDIDDPAKEKYVRRLVHYYYRQIEEIADGAPYIPAYTIIKTAMQLSLIDIGQELDDSVIEEATRIFKNLHVKRSALYPGVKELLESLTASNYKLGLITNSFIGNAQIITDKLGISSFFSAILDSGSFKGYKPMKKVFDFALDKMNSKAENALFVGDEYYADIFGAANAGMKTVWVDSRGRGLEYAMSQYNKTIVPDLIISKISELLDYV